MEVKGLSQGRQNVFTSNISTRSLDNNIKIEHIKNTEEISETKERKVTDEEVKIAADKLNKLLEGKETHVEYEPVGKAKHMGIKIVNNSTKEVLQELPPRKIVEMIDKLCELAGIMIDERV
ncbi:flagellar protein FlaG [Clostridium scatologenes]|uniref:Flagellin n=1 Tax=Clostridium scatologenes TaxID=1548 RepID=A0A0E3K1U9_CLOSL|nr:flagellar protein FlaG [Clostridium scatologenes]AKA70318.1 flagellin [Clostridium scatologenes]